MITKGRLGEHAEIRVDNLTVSTAASVATQYYSMDNADQITFIVGMGTALVSTLTDPTLTVNQSGDKGGATSTTIAGATGSMGAAAAYTLTNAHSALITMTTASTLTETIVINGYTLTYVGESTLVSTIATALAFGSSVGSSNAEGLETVMNSLSSVINNSTLSAFMTATTGTTANVGIVANNTASTDINITTTGVNLIPSYVQSQFVIDVKADDLNSTSQYVALSISSADTAINMSVAVVKTYLRNAPSFAVGGYVKTPTT